MTLTYREALIDTGHISVLTEGQAREALDSVGLQIVEEWKLGMYIPGVAEFLGRSGMAFEAWMEERVRGTWSDWILWTQCYVLKQQS